MRTFRIYYKDGEVTEAQGEDMHDALADPDVCAGQVIKCEEVFK